MSTLGGSDSTRHIDPIITTESHGHSMFQIKTILDQIGFVTKGQRVKLDSLTKQDFPCIAHLTKPEHFVVLFGIEDSTEISHFFVSFLSALWLINRQLLTLRIYCKIIITVT
jgi:ABC-type bacteriocin/lantibiotic exporter with double-glycine peptidase domain